jgi:succinyl-CoA synthetase beta subunit
LRCDVLAEGVVSAVKKTAIGVPVVIRLEGTNKEEGVAILNESGLNFTVAHDMREAAELAVSMLKSDA